MKKAQITKTKGKGKAINEVPRPSTKKYLSEYDRIFGKKGVGK
jgi:hypothetical protein